MESKEEKRKKIVAGSQEVGNPQPEDEMDAYPTDDSPSDIDDVDPNECDVTFTLAEWQELEPQLIALRLLKKNCKLLFYEIKKYQNSQRHMKYSELNKVKEKIFTLNDHFESYINHLQYDTRMELEKEKAENKS